MKINRASILLLLIAALAVTGCRRTPEAKMAKFLADGQKQMEKKDYPRAILQFKNAVQAKPKEAEPHYQLGLAYLASGDYRSGIAYLRKTVELNPKHTGAMLRLAELMSTSRDEKILVDAEKYVTQVLSASPDNVDALNTLAFAELKLGKPEDAEQHLRQALEKFPANLRTSVNLALIKLIQKDLKGAEAVLKDAVAHAPKSPQPAEALGRLYTVLGRSPEAEQQFRAALAINPKYGPALSDLGALQVRTGQIGPAEQTYKQLSTMPEKEYKLLYALYLFRVGRHADAIAEFQRLAKDDPADRNIRTKLVQAYLAVNRAADAEKVLGEALKKNSKDVAALFQRSRIYLGNGKYAEAQADLTQVVGIRKDYAEAHHMLSKVYQARGDAANRHQELTEALRVNPAYLPARLELAEVLVATNDAKSALNLLNETPEAQKKLPQAAIQVAIQRNWALLKADETAELRKEIDRLLAVARIPEVLLQDAALRLKQKDFIGARSPLEEVLKRNPGELRALDMLMRSYAGQKQLAAGLQKVKEYAAQSPKSAPVQNFLGRVLLNSDAAAARKAFEAAKAAVPGYFPADLALAQLDINEGKSDMARKSLSALIDRNTGRVEAHVLLASLDSKIGNKDAAIEHYRKVLEIEPRNAGTLNNLAYLLAENPNRADEALKYAEQAKEIAPASPEVDDTLGWVYYRKGIYPTAVKYLESATANSSTAVRKYHLAMAYLKAGNLKRGQQTLEAALKVDSKLPEAQAALQVFTDMEKRLR